MKLFNATVFMLLCFCTAIKAQMQNSPTTLKQADELLLKFPKQEVYVLSDQSTFDFQVVEIKGKTPELNVNSKKTTRYFSLKDNASIKVYDHYTTFCTLGNFDFNTQMYSKKGEPTEYVKSWQSVSDVAYQMNGVFHNDVRIKGTELRLPSKGGEIKIDIPKTYKDYKFLDPVYFYNDLNQKEVVVQFNVPSNILVEFKEINFSGYQISKKEVVDAKTKIKSITYSMNHLKSTETEYRSLPSAMELPHIIPIVKSFTTKAGEKVACFESFADLYKFCNDLYLQAGNDDAKIKPLVDKVLVGKTTDESKVKAIYYWVQDNIRYIAFEDGIAGYKPSSSQDVYEKKYGDCKGMANLITHMLTLAGFKANFVWIHTNYSPYKCDIPYIGIFNHAIAVVELNGKKYYLDGTETYASLGHNAFRIENRPVMLSTGASYSIDQIPAQPMNATQVVVKNELKFQDGILSGKGKSISTGDQKTSLIRGYHYTKSEEKPKYFSDFISSRNRNYNLTNVVTSDVDNRDIDLVINYDFSYNNAVMTDGSETYVKFETESYFSKSELDTNGILDFTYNMPINISVENTMEVPAGYKVAKLPKDLSLESSYATIKLGYMVVNNKIIYKRTYVIPTGIIPREKFVEWNNFQKELKKYYATQIELTK
jgi:hypothetical protein